MESENSSERPTLSLLDGIRVLSFAQLLQGPAGVQLLADMGADVIKVERPDGGAWERNWAGGETYISGVSAFFLAANRNQRSLTLNLKHPDAIGIARRLVARADVVVENFRPGVMNRLGLGYEQMSELNPGLVYCSSSGYGSSGPYRDRAGQDLLLQAMSGLASMTGTADDLPTPCGAPVVDQHAASLLAAGVLGALLQRTRSGRGQKIEISLFMSALDLQMEPLTYFLNGGDVTRRSHEGLGSAFHAAPYGIYRTRDGYIALSITPLPKLAGLIDVPALSAYDTEQKALEDRDAVKKMIQARLIEETTQHWLDLLQASDVWCGPVFSYPDLVEDPQVRHMAPFWELTYPKAGRVKVVAHPIAYSSGAPGVRMRPPLLGEHTVSILEEIGYSEEEIEGLKAQGAI
jgi:crotonobetainyl-CoA:carnitine CoA-transferase CaiB-like acyl-CoA transferase